MKDLNQQMGDLSTIHGIFGVSNLNTNFERLEISDPTLMRPDNSGTRGSKSCVLISDMCSSKNSSNMTLGKKRTFRELERWDTSQNKNNQI